MTNVEARIRSSYGSLSETERKAADYFLSHMEASYSLPIAQLAREAGVSPTAWVRLCKAVGYEGLKEMRKHLLVERMNEPQEAPEDDRYFSDLNEGSDAAQILQTVSNTSIQAIRDTAKMLDQNALYEAADCILKASTIRLFGVGASALVAEDLYHKLTRINRYALFSPDSHVQLSYSSTLSARDVAVFVSNTGATQETLETLRAAKQSGCRTIGITRYSKSPLAAGCDILLYTVSPEVYVRSGAMSSRMAQLMTVDVLFTLVASKEYSTIQQPLENSYKICQTHRVKE